MTSETRGTHSERQRAGGPPWLVVGGELDGIVALLERLTDTPCSGLDAAISALPPHEQVRLQALATDILRDRRDLGQ